MTAIWQILVARAPSILETLFQQELQLIIFIPLVLWVDKLSREAGPKFLHILWLFPLARALWPPIFDLPRISVLPNNLTEIPVTLTPFSGSPLLQNSGSYLTFSQILVLLWVTASGILAVFITTRFIAFRLKLYFSPALRWDISKVLPSSQYRWPTAYLTDGLHSPITVGFFRQRIYLNPASVESPPRMLQAILHHELAHVIRLDSWVTLLQGIVLVLHPFNPLVWLMNQRISGYREQLCDDFALQSRSLDSREYSHMLLGHLRKSVLPALATPTRTCFFETKHGLVQRLHYLAKWKEENMPKPIRRTQVVLLAGLAITMVLTAFQCQVEKSPLGEESVAVPARAERNQSESVDAPSSPPFTATLKANALFEPDYTPPSPPPNADVTFIPYDTPPSLVDGLAAITNNLHYPEASLQDRSEGMVILQFQVLASGQTGEYIAVLQNTSGDPRLAEAAKATIRKVAWNPAEANGEKVSVWISIPVHFKLPD